MKNAIFSSTVIAVGLFAATAQLAQADTYPSRTVTLVVPFPAGSTTDSVARKMAEFMRTKVAVTVIVENKAGADGNIAAQHVLRQPADGYTVFITGNSVHGANANIYKEMPFDPINDFEAVGGVMSIPMVLTVKPDFPANNVREFVIEAKKRDKPMLYASGNTSTRGVTELFKVRYGIKMDHVPYKGSPQVVADLAGGQFDAAFVDANTVGAFIRDGRLKGLAISSTERLSTLPNIPTVAEGGVPGFQFGAWVGVVVRARTPPEVVGQLGKLVEDFTKDPSTLSYLSSIGGGPMTMNARQLKTFIESETKTWAEIVKVANIEKK